MTKLLMFIALLCVTKAEIENGSWKQDISNDMHIGPSFTGYTQAVVECSDDWIAFVISMDKDFHGVIYTRGNFYKRDGPCFLKAQGGKDFALKLPMKDCGIKMNDEEQGHIATVIVQYDSDLMMPGDLGFRLLCRKDSAVKASLEGMKSQISIVDPDPSEKSTFDGGLSAMSPSNIATIKPLKMPMARDEL